MSYRNFPPTDDNLLRLNFPLEQFLMCFGPPFQNILKRLEGVVDRNLNRGHDLVGLWNVDVEYTLSWQSAALDVAEL